MNKLRRFILTLIALATVVFEYVYKKVARSWLVRSKSKKAYALRFMSISTIAVMILQLGGPVSRKFVAYALNGNSNLNGYIWENDDGSTIDGNSQLAAGNGSVSVPKGSKLNLRAQIKNTGTAMDLSKLGLFYDRGDGAWSKVKSTETVNDEGLGLSKTLLDKTGVRNGYYAYTLSANGTPWMSYSLSVTNSLGVMKYVGSGGNCTDTAWSCMNVDDIAATTGQHTSIKTDSSNNAWVSYNDVTNTALKVATYVGSGGNCTDTAWNCTTVDNTGTSTGQFTSIAFDNSNNAWVSYYDVTNTALKLAKYVGSGGTGCTDTAWTCTTVDNTGTSTGASSSIAFDGSNNAWISYYDTTNTALKLAKYVGSGGTGCTDTAWTCTTVDNTGTNTGQHSYITFDISGTAWISSGATPIRIAQYVGTGGTGCTDTAWTCTTIDAPPNGISSNTRTTIYFNPVTNNPEMVYGNSGKYYTVLAVYVGSNGTGCSGTTAWTCTTIDQFHTEFSTYLFYDSNGTRWAYSVGSRAYKFNLSVLPDNDSSCSDASIFSCLLIDTNIRSTAQTSMKLDNSGVPWIAYQNNSPNLEITKYVGVGGTGCSSTTAWNCTTIDTRVGSNALAHALSMGIDKSTNTPWIAYYDSGTTNDLRIAKYVGSGGTGCTDAGWTCTIVDSTGDVGNGLSVAIDSSGTPWIAYTDTTNTALKVAKYVSSGGTGCATTAWTCTTVDNTGTSLGQYPSIAFDSTSTAWISYYDTTNTALKVAKFVTSGGSGCTSAAWTCTTVDNTGTTTGNAMGNNAIAIDPSDKPWISYINTQDGMIRTAQYVGSGGNCTDTAWNCSNVADGDGEVAIAFDPSGRPWLSFQSNNSNPQLTLANYVGNGNGDCAIGSDWECEVASIPQTSFPGSGDGSSIIFNWDGRPMISSFDGSSSTLTLVYLDRRGEVLFNNSQRGVGGTISESHVDMSSTTDTTNRDDADCIGGGTWNNGIVIAAEQGFVGTLADGTGTAQCTEVVFSIDLSQAVVGGTYRFMIATNDALQSSGGIWRGPVSIASGAIPTLTVTDSSYSYAKDNLLAMANCTDTAWGCAGIDTTNDVGAYNSMIIDQTGTPWVSFYDTTNGNLRVAKYVGSSGTGCASSAWTCTDVDTTNTVGQYSSMAVDKNGTVWVSYYYGTGGDLRVAKYVGSSGTGCASSAWTCTDIETTNDVGKYSSIAIDISNNPWISYYDTTGGNLRVAQFVGSSGTGCASSAWTCTAVDTTNDVGGSDTNITFSTDGIAYISYYDVTNANLRVAQYVGMGGTGCAVTSWTCTAVDSTNDAGQYSSIAVDNSGVVWVSYMYTTGTDLRVAKYVGTGGTGCAVTTWTCTDVLTTPTTANDSSIAIGPDGYPWVASHSTTSDALRVSRFVGGASGSGCASTDWTCTTVDNSTAAQSRLVFDGTGSAWVSYYGGTVDLKVAKLHRPFSVPSATALGAFNGINASKSWARLAPTFGQKSGDANGNCSGGLTDYQGVCAYYQNNGDYDTLTTLANESAYLTFATKFSTNSELPTAQWVGKTSLAPNTASTAGDVVLQIYRYGTTNAWETLASNTTSSDCNTDNCTLNGIASGTASEYFSLGSDGKYTVYFRMYQEASSSTGITFKTDQFSAFTTAQKLKRGKVFQDGIKRALNQR